MRLSQQVYCGSRAYRVVGHPFIILKSGGRWHIMPRNSQGQTWADRMQPGLINLRFITRREAMDTLQALHALDPMPKDSLLPRSILKPREEGGYLVITPSKARFVLTQAEGGGWTATDPAGCCFGPWHSLTDARMRLAEAWHIL